MFLGWIALCVDNGNAEYSHHSAFLQEMSKVVHVPLWMVVHWEEIEDVDSVL